MVMGCIPFSLKRMLCDVGELSPGNSYIGELLRKGVEKQKAFEKLRFTVVLEKENKN